jgi:hypothetical protein
MSTHWGHDVSATSDTATAFVGVGRHVHDESKSEDRAVVVAGGRIAFHLTGHAVGVVVSATAPNLDVKGPGTAMQQAAHSAPWLAAPCSAH